MAEADLYQPIKEKLEELLAAKGRPFRLEITAVTGLSEALKAKFPEGSEIVFAFLKKRPDLFGFIENQYSADLITVEVEERLETLDALYQAKLYKEVFGARYGFLITAQPIPEAMKRLCRRAIDILRSASDGIYCFLAIGQFDKDKRQFVDWVDADPFEKDHYWR